MRRFTSIFIKRDKTSDLSSSSSSTNSDHSTPWKSWIGAKRLSQKPPPIVVDEEDSPSEEEDEEDEEDDGYDPNNIRIRIQNALAVHPHANSPFVHHPDQPIFPRSCNNTNVLKTSSSIRISMFNSRLLARLDSTALAPSELSLLGSKPQSSINHPILPSSDIARPPTSSHISSASSGIQRWIARPCFEDRFLVYSPTDNAIQCRPVTSSMAIAALEYPEYLDVMADPDFDQSPIPDKSVFDHSLHVDPSQPVQSHAFPSELSSASAMPIHWRNSSTAVPSPLRIQHSPSFPSTKKDMPTLVPPAQKTTVKRVVRFAEDDEDDGIPLHMIRMKKKREEKAKFLRLEQLKRTIEQEQEQKLLEQERRLKEQERKLKELELLERERRRLAKEKEKRESDKGLYADAIVAARIRREGNRAGTIPSNTTNSSNLLAPSPSFTSLRNSKRNKPLTDSRKLTSKSPFDSSPSLSLPRRDSSDPAYYHHHSDSSPGSSRSPSVGHSPVSPNSSSRPPSMYSAHTSSSEEVRQQRGSRRNSVTPAGVASVSGAPSSYRRPSYPTWSGSSPTIPQVHPLPDFGHDMPLLPPTAPFMKGSSYNRKSQSPGHSSTSSSRRGSFNSSNELVNEPWTTNASSTSLHHHSTTAVPPTSHTKAERRLTHERRSSSGSTTHSLHSTQHQQRPIPTSSWSQPMVSRGRPALPSQYLQTPSPWPALPQNGLVPVPMPMGYNSMNGYPVLFYPTMPMQGMQLGSGGEARGINNGWREPLIS